MIKQFLYFFKPYYYSFIKKYFHQFIANIRKIEFYSNISSRKYNKKINKRNIYDNEKSFKELKSDQLNYSNNILSDINNREKSNCISSYNSNSKKMQSEKKFLSPNKKINVFLINNNNLNFSKGNLLKNELYRNNSELEKKYSQIMQRKKRKKMLENEDYSISQIKNTNKSIDIKAHNNNYIINKIYEKKNNKIKNGYNILSNTEIPKEDSIKVEKSKYIKKITIPKRDIEKNIKIKENKLKDKSNEKLTRKSSRRDKKYDFKNNIFIKVNRINISEKNNNINNPHYNKSVITKNIKNILTKDKKINIHINYVFFIPKNIIKKDKNIECLQISPIYSYNYLGNEKKKKKKIYSKKNLTSIQEEEEKSKCSISIMLQNSKINDEYNSNICNLIKQVNNFKLAKMKKNLLYKLKIINLIFCIKRILKGKIFKKTKLTNEKNKKEDNYSNKRSKLNFPKRNIMVDDKLIINTNNKNNLYKLRK